MAEVESSTEVLAREIDKTVEIFISDAASKLGKAERQIDDLTYKVAKATAQRQRKTLLAPISGTVQASIIGTIGQVAIPGQEVLHLMPDDPRLQLQVYVLNTDIGFVRPGQEAMVKIQSFPFTRYGTINAKVARVAADAIPEPDAAQLEGNLGARIAKSSFAGADRTRTWCPLLRTRRIAR